MIYLLFNYYKERHERRQTGGGKVRLCLSVITCNFEHALRGMRDGGGHPHRRIAAPLETGWLTEALRLLQLSFTPCILADALWGLLSPLARSLCFETPRVITATIQLQTRFAVLAVPGQATLHQGALLCISAELRRQTGRGTVWVTISAVSELVCLIYRADWVNVFCNLCLIYVSAFHWEGMRDGLM